MSHAMQQVREKLPKLNVENTAWMIVEILGTDEDVKIDEFTVKTLQESTKRSKWCATMQKNSTLTKSIF